MPFGRLLAILVSALWKCPEVKAATNRADGTFARLAEPPPEEIMRTIRSLHARGAGESAIEEISRVFLASRGEDRIGWAARILVATDRRQEAEQLLCSNLAGAPQNSATRIALAEFALDNLEWIRYEAHLREVQQAESTPGLLQLRISSILRCLDFLTRDAARKPAETLKIPDSIYECLLESEPLERYQPIRNKVVLVGATMAAGGAERVLAVAYKGLKERRTRNINLWLYTAQEDIGNGFYLQEMNIDRRECVVLDADDVIPEPFSWLPFQHARRTYNLYRKILEDRPDILHGWQDGVNLDVLLAGAMAGVRKIVLHTHNMQPDKVHRMRITDSLQRIYTAGLRRPNTHLVCVSEAALDDYMKWLHLKRRVHHHVIYNGFPLAATRPERRRALRERYRGDYGIPAEKFVVGSAFRFDPIKRPLLWFAVARSLIDRIPNVHFVIFGTGELHQTLMDLVVEHNLTSFFTLPGLVFNVPDRLCLLDVFLLTSSSEGLPTVVIEAQYAGVPVVAPLVGGIAECVVEGQTALLVRDDDSATFAAGVLEVRNCSQYRFDPTGEAGDFLRERFTEQKMISSIEEVYTQFD